MSTINADLIKDLREQTGAGMLNCKKALEECNGDFEQAKDLLRKKGLAAAAKKSGRVASEGLVSVYQQGNKAAVIELNSETDFVAKNEKFQALATKFAEYAFAVKGDIEKLKQYVCPQNKKSVQDVITDNIAVIGENINLRRSKFLEAPDNGLLSVYIHNSEKAGLGKIAVLVALESNAEKAKLAQLGKQLAMHIAASKPESLNIDGVNKESLARERAIYADQAKSSGKPAEIIDKMVEGRVRKYYEQVVLLEQLFVIDGKTKISDVLKNTAKEVGADIKILDYVQFTLGEGIEKEEKDFAAEVRAAGGR